MYGASDGLKTVVVERGAVGGQAGSSSCIENYLGFSKGISGADLAERAREQACKFGAEILLARKGVRGQFTAGKGAGYLEDGTKIIARASICATGVEYRRLGLPNEGRFLGAGVFYGAGVSEASLLKGEHVYIVGGGNSAGQAAMHFVSTAKRISIVIREDSLTQTLSKYLIDRIQAAPNVEVLLRTEVTALHGDHALDEITLVDRTSRQERRVPAHWLFVCIGGVPQTDWAQDVGIVRDETGYLVTGPRLDHRRETSCELALGARPVLSGNERARRVRRWRRPPRFSEAVCVGRRRRRHGGGVRAPLPPEAVSRSRDRNATSSPSCRTASEADLYRSTSAFSVSGRCA